MQVRLVPSITGKNCDFTFLSQRRAHVATTSAIFFSPPMSVFVFAIFGGHSFSCSYYFKAKLHFQGSGN